MKRRVGLIVIAVALLAMAIWLWSEEDMQSLPDGTLIQLCATTSGTTHEVNLGSRWRSNLRAVLPRTLARKIRPPIMGQVTTTQDSLVVWFKADEDPSHAGRRFNLGSRYECTLVDAEGKRLAADSLNQIIAPSLHGDGTRLYYAVFPSPPEGSLTLDIQERVVNTNDTISYRHPIPAGAGLSGAYLKTNGMLRFVIPNDGRQ
jgi:hypothetical protein